METIARMHRGNETTEGDLELQVDGVRDDEE